MSPDLVACPQCRAPLTGGPECVACGLPLVGPEAGRLWQVDQRLMLLAEEQDELREERAQLLRSLRTGAPPSPSRAPKAPVDPFAPQTHPAPAGSGAPPPAVPVQPMPLKPATPAPESSPQQVQNTLLTLGAVLLAGAGLVFAAVTYQQLGLVGRVVVLLALTAVAAAAPVVLARRGLTASAQAVAAVALALGLVDIWSARRAGLGTGVDVRTYSAWATAVLAAATVGYTRVLPLPLVRAAAVLLAQLPLLLLIARAEPSRPVTAVLLTVLGAVNAAAALDWRQGMPRDARVTALAVAAGLVAASLPFSALAIDAGDPGAGAGLLAVAVLLAVASARREAEAVRPGLSGVAVLLLGAAAWITADPSLARDDQPLSLVAVALVAAALSRLLPREHRIGPAAGSVGLVLAAVVTQAEPVVVALAGPLSWLGAPWSNEVTAARGAVSTEAAWTGSVVTLVVLVAALACLLGTGWLLHARDAVMVPAAVLGVITAAVLPLALDLTYAAALGVLVLLAGALGASGVLLGRHRDALVGASAGIAMLTATWSVADREATLVVLPTLTVMAGVLALRVPLAAGAAALLLGASVAAVGASQDLTAPEVGGLLLIAPATAVGLSFVLQSTRRLALEAAAVVLSAWTITLAVDDDAWLTWNLAVTGLLALAVAIRPDRRGAALLGGLLLSASSWVRLAEANVTAPEPYVAPLALTALVFGHLRRRANPGTSSFEAYAAGLSLGLVPTLLRALADDSATRGLLLLLGCVGVVVAGAHWRLRALLAIGGGVLLVDVLNLLGPYARAMPRWVLLAAAGLLLVTLGMTYEQRRRDLAQLKERYEQLS